jgi:hypothetical protein
MEGIRQALGRHVKVLHRAPVKLEKGGDRTDNRVLVFTPHRLFVMTTKVPLAPAPAPARSCWSDLDCWV